MTYELAKELMEAGFPNNTKDIVPTRKHYPVKEPREGYLVEPTLSELIEACGDDLYCLTKRTKLKGFQADEWTAFQKMEDRTLTTNGSTSEEAVARLWLALNKKS